VNPPEIVVWSLAGIGVIALLWTASQQTGEKAAAEVQAKGDVMGWGVQADTGASIGTPLDMSLHLHGWHPGYDPQPHLTPVSNTPHRYPAIPGGNISTVMHQGWSQASKAAPAGDSWRLNPPEAAVL